MRATLPPPISVLMPVRNAAATLPRALASLSAQTRTDWEAVIVDDGSTDDTAAVLAAWARRDPRFRIVRQDARGIVAALNAGLAEARGRWVARLDADDEALPARLALQSAALEGDSGLGVVSGRVLYGGEAGRHRGYALHVAWLNEVTTEEAIRLNRFIEAPLAHPSVMFRRELVHSLGGYRDGDFPEDYELWLRWAEAGVRMAKVPEAVLRWHDLPDRLSRTDPRYRPAAFYRLKAAYLARELARIASGRDVWVCGAGRPTRRRAAFLEEHGVKITGFVDVDPRKIGGQIRGRPVVAPEALPPCDRTFALGYVGTRGAREAMRAMFAAQGRVEGRDYLMAA